MRRVADEIPLGDYRSVRAYRIAVLGKDLNYEKKPKEHIPWPQDSVKYIRFSSKEQMEPQDEEGQRLQSRLIFFLDAVMDACLTRYETACRWAWNTAQDR